LINYKRSWYLKNRDRILKMAKVYYQEHKKEKQVYANNHYQEIKSTKEYKENHKESRRIYYIEHKDRCKKDMENYNKIHPWANIYRSIDSRVNDKKGERSKYYYNKGIKNELTFKDLETLYIRDNVGKMKHPEIHRIDSDKNYTFENCKFLEREIHKNIHFGKGK